jgi:hypothetical protein
MLLRYTPVLAVLVTGCHADAPPPAAVHENDTFVKRSGEAVDAGIREIPLPPSAAHTTLDARRRLEITKADADAIAVALKAVVDARKEDAFDWMLIAVPVPTGYIDPDDGEVRIGHWRLEARNGEPTLVSRLFVNDVIRVGYVAPVTKIGDAWRVGELQRVVVHALRK